MPRLQPLELLGILFKAGPAGAVHGGALHAAEALHERRQWNGPW